MLIPRRINSIYVLAFAAVVTLIYSDPALAAFVTVNRANTHIVSINPSTGAETVIAPLPLGSSVAGGTSTFDVAGRRLFYLASDGVTLYLVTVSLDTGAVTQVAVPSAGLLAEYDPVTGNVLIDSGATLRAVDPTTGAGTTVASLPSTGIAGGTSTFDAVGRRLFYLGSDGVTVFLVTVSLTSGTATQVPIASAGLLAEYDAVTGTVVVDSGSGLSAVNPTTGTSTPVATLPPTGIAGGTSTFDEGGRRFFYISSDGVTISLVTVSLITGNVTQIPFASSGIFVEYDAATADVPALTPSMLLLLVFAISCLGLLRATRL